MFEIKLNKSKADIYYKSELQTSKNAWCKIRFLYIYVEIKVAVIGLAVKKESPVNYQLNLMMLKK